MGQLWMGVPDYSWGLTLWKALTDTLAVVGLASTLSWVCGLWPQWNRYTEQRRKRSANSIY